MTREVIIWHPHIWLIAIAFVVLLALDVNRRVLMVAALAVLFLGLCGCAALRSPAELTYQGIHGVEIAQTLHGIAWDHDCYYEADPVTAALIGHHPSTSKVLAEGIGWAAAHAAITDYLLTHGHRRIADAFEAVTIAGVVVGSTHNYSIGIRLGMPNHPSEGCSTP